MALLAFQSGRDTSQLWDHCTALPCRLPHAQAIWGLETLLALGITMHMDVEVQECHGASDCCADVGVWEVFPSLGIAMCWHLVLGHNPDCELPQVGVWSLSFPGPIESPHLGQTDIPDCGAIMHGHLEVTASQICLRTNCSLSPVQANATHKDQVPAKPKPVKL